MSLPSEIRIHPGHREPSTIGAEWEANPFIRVYAGLDPEGAEERVRGEDATSFSGAPTTTARTRHGCAIRTAATRSSAGRRSSVSEGCA